MARLLRFVKPSWWSYHWQHRNVLRFWWQYLTTHPFPAEISSIDDLVAFGERHTTLGFNRESFRSYIIWKLYQHFRCTSFVETGTLYGSTAAYVKRVFKSPILTSEINPTYYVISKINLFWARGINKFLSNSPDFLRKVCESSAIGDRPMFYLDAHWYDYVPLPEELAIIAEKCQQAIIVIDDFFIPSEPRFQHDEYESLRIDIDVVDSALRSRRQDVTVYFPAYSPDKDPTGKGIGYAVVVMGEEKLPGDVFPFDLLADETGTRTGQGPVLDGPP